ncbi:nucleoid-associated protein [Microbacterium sp. LWH10-1.2]|uniref:nucleoid-associated protein n=1 Tax=Microbacterium sp. LWH10-1.2 TaxID=3135255 RepID=UPI00313972AC
MLQPSFAKGREIVYGTDFGSPIPDLARSVLQDPSQLQLASQRMAAHLHAAQGGSASAGVFLCSLARADSIDRLIIMKAEHQEGVRLRQTVDDDGVISFEVEHLDELILGRAAQVYKIALLWISPTSDRLTGLMVDRQNGQGYADYFLDRYLGFELVHQAEKLTEDFVKSMGRFLKSSSLSDEKKLRYGGAIAAVLESPTPSLNASNFVRDFIDREDRDELIALLPQQVLANEFRKDTTLVSSAIGGLRVRTQHGVIIQASTGAIDSGLVEVSDTSIVINDNPESYDLSKGPR